MHYYSTNNRGLRTGLKEALMRGLAPDRGLYMPGHIPVLGRERLEAIKSMNLTEIAVELSGLLFGEDIPATELKPLVEEAVNFDTPLVQVEEDLYSLELFHGPTLAFKDVGARFLARMLGYYTREGDGEIHVLVATSGDTGSAVANGFLGVPGIKVHVLYPSGLVSPLQEKQFTTLGENISAVEVEGTFDDCQRLVKEAFMDEDLASGMTLTSANSINLARFLPQAFYYFRAWAQLCQMGTGIGLKAEAGAGDFFFAVPSGNYGNMTAGLVAWKMGLPVSKFISANNINDIVPKYLESGQYNPRPSVATLANAMDVGDPSNFVRILDLFDGDHNKLSSNLLAYSYKDQEIREIIRDVYDRTGYLCDPHGATGYRAARSYLDILTDQRPGDPGPGSGPESGKATNPTGIFLETAHPAKFKETVEDVLGEPVAIPDRLAAFANREKQSTSIGPGYEEFKSYLQEKAWAI